MTSAVNILSLATRSGATPLSANGVVADPPTALRSPVTAMPVLGGTVAALTLANTVSGCPCSTDGAARDATIPRLTCARQLAGSAFLRRRGTSSPRSHSGCRRYRRDRAPPGRRSMPRSALVVRTTPGKLAEFRRRPSPNALVARALPDLIDDVRREQARGECDATVITETVRGVGQIAEWACPRRRSRWLQSHSRPGRSSPGGITVFAGMVARVAIDGRGVVRGGANQPAADVDRRELPALNNSMNSSLSPLGTAEAVFADHDAGRAARRHLLLHRTSLLQRRPQRSQPPQTKFAIS